MFLFILSFLFLSHTVLSTIVDVRWLTLQSLLSAIRPLCLPAYCHCYAFICHTQGCQVFCAMYFVFVIACIVDSLLLFNINNGHSNVTYKYTILCCVIFIHLFQNECRTYHMHNITFSTIFSYNLVHSYVYQNNNYIQHIDPYFTISRRILNLRIFLKYFLLRNFIAFYI